jgi:hypothetical protein
MNSPASTRFYLSLFRLQNHPHLSKEIVMKCCFSVALVVLCFAVAINSIDREAFTARQGSMWLGGSFGFSTMGVKEKDISLIDNSDYRINSLTFSPTLRFFPAHYFAIGPKVSWIGMFYHMGSSGTYQYNLSMNTWGLGGEMGFVYGTEFIIPFIFAAPQASIIKEKDEFSSTFSSEPDDEPDVEQMFVLPFSAGAIIPVGKNLGIQIETGIKFSFHKDFTMNTFSIGIGICGFNEKVAVSMVNYLSPYDTFYY